MDLFTVGKIPVYCDGITHRLETRKSGETKVVDLTLKIQPFTGQLAAALDPAEYGFVKRVLFKMDSGDPTVDLRAAEFTPPGDRQRLTCYATSDSTEPSIVIDHAKVTKLRARRGKEVHGWTLYVGVSFGPLSKDELAWANQFYTSQSFITFEEAEPSLDFTDDDDDDAPARSSRPAAMWDEGEVVQALQHALLAKRCFLTIDMLDSLSDAEREGLAKWARAKGGPVWPPVLAKSHVAGEAPDGSIGCRKCGQPFPADSQVGDIAGLDCAGVDLEDARPIAKRGSKKTAKIDPEAERAAQSADGRKREVAH